MDMNSGHLVEMLKKEDARLAGQLNRRQSEAYELSRDLHCLDNSVAGQDRAKRRPTLHAPERLLPAIASNAGFDTAATRYPS